MKVSSFCKFLNPFRILRRMKVLDGIYSCSKFSMMLERECSRVDRNNRCFAVVAFNIGNAEVNRDYSNALIDVLYYRRLRLPDEIGWFDKHRIGILLHNTGREGAWCFINNIQEAFPAKYHPLDCKVYVYPGDDYDGIPIVHNKRIRERFNVQAKCLISTDGDNNGKVTIELLATNISTSGAFLQTDHPLPIGTELVIDNVHLMHGWKRHDEDNIVTKVTGYVIWIDERGMAICFDKDCAVNLSKKF